MDESFEEYEFKERVQEALRTVRLILGDNRRITSPDKAPHVYQDKFLLANISTRMSIAACVTILKSIGLSTAQLATLQTWAAASQAVSLRLDAIERFKFISETSRSVENPHSQSTSTLGITSTTKSFTKITEFNFKFDVEWRISAFRGVGDDPEGHIVLSSHAASQDIVLRSKDGIFPESHAVQHDVNISWMLRHLDDQAASFEINRANDKCFTPRRNPDIEEACVCLLEVHTWTEHVSSYFLKHLFPVQTKYSQEKVKPNVSLIEVNELFIPVLPLVEMTDAETAQVIDQPTVEALLQEYDRALTVKCTGFTEHFSTGACIVSSAAAATVLCILQLTQIALCYFESINFIESIIRKQLIAAVGKTVHPSDFDAYMQFHYRRLLKEEYQPRPFSHAVRRSMEHSPEGTVRIESCVSGTTAQPLTMFTRSEAASPASRMKFALSASSTVTFGGERHLHLYLGHSFSGESQSQLNLVAQARQFSNYILVVGRIASATEFDPKYAIILQNKDEISIPLFLEQIPTAKEFRNAIESLSPEQQRFASAIRAMQLGGTVFGVLVIQIKPHLEELLKLRPDSLTKEIALGQDLMEMFIKYQIPSDLLSFQGDDEADAAARITQVRGHVGKIKELIQASKEEEVKEKMMYDDAVFGAAERKASSGAPLFGAPPLPPGSMYRESADRVMPSMKMMSFASQARSLSTSSFGFAPPPPVMQSAPAMQMEEEAFALDGGMVQGDADEFAGGDDDVVGGDVGGSVPVDAIAQREAQQEHASGSRTDYTAMPSRLDKAHDKLDPDSALRSTIINPSENWSKTSQKGLMQAPKTASLYAKDLEKERNAAFDLLDALSRSGSSVLEHAALHVVIASTHCFDKTLLDTVVQENVNPIERVERSSLIMATTLQGVAAVDLLKTDQQARVKAASPALFIENDVEVAV